MIMSVYKQTCVRSHAKYQLMMLHGAQEMTSFYTGGIETALERLNSGHIFIANNSENMLGRAIRFSSQY